MPNEQNIGQEVIGEVEVAAANIVEAGISGGVPGAVTAAISEVAKAAGEVAEVVVDKLEGHDEEPVRVFVNPDLINGLMSSVRDNHGVQIIEPDSTSSPPPTTFTLIEQWAKDRNLLSGSNPMAQMLKGVSEIGELADAVLKNDLPNIIDGIGDVVVVLTILAAQHGLKITDCIEAAYNEIKDRKGVMYNGAFIKSDDARYESIMAELAGAKSGV